MALHEDGGPKWDALPADRDMPKLAGHSASTISWWSTCSMVSKHDEIDAGRRQRNAVAPARARA